MATPPLAWLTDFVGYLPTPDGHDHDAELTAVYNEEMLELVDRFQSGSGTGHCLCARSNTGRSGRVRRGGRDPRRVRLPPRRAHLLTVGGPGIGRELLRRAITAYPWAVAAVPGLRRIVIAGPRIDPATLSTVGGVEVRGYVPDLHRQLAVCELVYSAVDRASALRVWHAVSRRRRSAALTRSRW